MATWARRAGAVVACLAVLAPATADAAVTRVLVHPGGQYCDIKGCSQRPPGYRLVGSAGPDQVTLSPGGPGAVTVEDPGGVSGCSPISATRAVCALAGVDVITLDAGADRISLAGLTGPLPQVLGKQIAVIGGGGDDLLVGSPHADTLDGAEGADRLTAGAGGDSLVGGGGDDFLDGGPGTDSVLYGERADVDLVREAPNGPIGQSDQLTGIEGVSSGRGGTLAGDSGPNTLTAPGRGLVAGRGGDDILVGGRLEGGAGDDHLAASGFVSGVTVGGDVRPRVNCGRGRDLVDANEAAPASVTADCERIRHEDYRMSLALRRRSARGVIARVTGLRCGDTKACRASLVLRGRGVLGSSRTRYLNRRGRLALRLSRRGRAAFRRARRTVVRLELVVRGSDGHRTRIATTLVRR